jgi:hypothetical protein
VDGDEEFCVFVITETGFLCPDRLPAAYEVAGTGEENFGVCAAEEGLSDARTRAVVSTAIQDGDIGGEEVKNELPDPQHKVDILWVVDNSGSMCEEQAAIRSDILDFLEPLNQAGVDYQIGVVTTDMSNPSQSGLLQAGFDGGVGLACSIAVDVTDCPARIGPILRSNDAPADVLKRDLGCLITHGTNGDGFEMGLEAALVATSPELLAGAHAGFIRDDADLALVILSDENDCSDRGAVDKVNGNACEWNSDLLVSVEEYVEHFRALKGEQRVLVAAIIAPDTGPAIPARTQCNHRARPRRERGTPAIVTSNSPSPSRTPCCRAFATSRSA